MDLDVFIGILLIVTVQVTGIDGITKLIETKEIRFLNEDREQTHYSAGIYLLFHQ